MRPLWFGDFLRGGLRNPTRSWPVQPLGALTFHLPERSLNGIPLGAPFEALKAFGPAATTAWTGDYLDLIYRQHGFLLGLDLDRSLADVRVALAPGDLEADRLRLISTSLRLLLATGRTLDLGSSSTDAQLQTAFGAPVDEFTSEGQRLSIFTAAGCHVEACRSAAGALVSVEIGEAGE